MPLVKRCETQMNLGLESVLVPAGVEKSRTFHLLECIWTLCMHEKLVGVVI